MQTRRPLDEPLSVKFVMWLRLTIAWNRMDVIESETIFGSTQLTKKKKNAKKILRHLSLLLRSLNVPTDR